MSFTWLFLSLLLRFSMLSPLARWEIGEYFGEGVVIIGVLVEYLAEFHLLQGKENEQRRRGVTKRASLILLFGLAVELTGLIRTSQLSGALIAALNTDVGNAQRSADNAADAADRANFSASKAELLARGARQEADSFEKEIVSAKEQAATAESHLAGALERATKATEALHRLESPRSLTNIPKLISILEEFKDTEYTFSSVFANNESIYLLRSIDDVLQQSGWKRTKPPNGFGLINVFGRKDDPLLVPEALVSGIHISVDCSNDELSVLRSLPLNKMPMLARAATSLNFALSSGISPRELPWPVDFVKGDSKTVLISIGQKP